MVATRIHPSDIVTHNYQNVWFAVCHVCLSFLFLLIVSKVDHLEELLAGRTLVLVLSF